MMVVCNVFHSREVHRMGDGLSNKVMARLT